MIRELIVPAGTTLFHVAGKYLGERFHRAGGVPAVLCELIRAGRVDGDALTVSGKTIADNVQGRTSNDREMICQYDKPLMERAGFLEKVTLQ